MAIAEMAKAVGGRPLAQLLFVIDARVAGDQGDAMHAFEHVEAIVHAVTPRDHKMELLAAVESGPLDAPPSLALTRFFIQAIDDASALGADGSMLMSTRVRDDDRAPGVRHDRAELRAREGAERLHGRGADRRARVGGPVVGHAEREQRGPRAPAVGEGVRAPSTRTPWRARAVVPMPAIGPILADAESAHKKRDWDRALDGYKKALMILGEKEPQAMASVYASIADVKLAQGKVREAEASLEKALAADPGHARSVSALVKMATEAKDWRRAAGIERRAARALTDDAEAHRGLRALGRALRGREGSPHRGRGARGGARRSPERACAALGAPRRVRSLASVEEARRSPRRDGRGGAAPARQGAASIRASGRGAGEAARRRGGARRPRVCARRGPDARARARRDRGGSHPARGVARPRQGVREADRRVCAPRGRGASVGDLQTARAAPARQARRRSRGARCVHGGREAAPEGRRVARRARRAARGEGGSGSGDRRARDRRARGSLTRRDAPPALRASSPRGGD